MLALFYIDESALAADVPDLPRKPWVPRGMLPTEIKSERIPDDEFPGQRLFTACGHSQIPTILGITIGILFLHLPESWMQAAWMKSIGVPTIGVFLFGILLTSLPSWLFHSYRAMLHVARAPGVTIQRRDYLLGSMYIRYIGLLGGFIGVICAAISIFAPLWSDSPGTLPLWTTVTAAQWFILVVGIVLFSIFRSKRETPLKFVIACCSAIALFIWTPDVQFQIVIVGITLLVVVFAWSCSIVNEFLSNSSLPGWRSITDNLHLIPIAIVFYVGMTKAFEYSSRTDLLVLNQALSLYAYFGWLAVIFLTFSLVTAWTGMNYPSVRTENSPLFNAGHNGLFLLASLGVGIFAAILTRAVVAFQGGSVAILVVLGTALLLGLFGVVIKLMLRSVNISRQHIRSGKHNQQLLDQLTPTERRRRWNRVLSWWMVADLTLLIVIIAFPWGALILETLQ